MPRYDDYDDDDEQFDYGSQPIENQKEFLYDLIGFNQNALDNDARTMFWDVMYNDELSVGARLDTYDRLVDYLWNEYGMDFAELWDWDDFREWYDSV